MPQALAARQEGADHAAAVGGAEDLSDRQVGLVERGIGGEQRAVAQIDDAEARRADDAHAGRAHDLGQPALARDARSAGLGEPVGQHRRHRDARRPHASIASIAASVGAHDISVLGHLRQRFEGGPGAFAEHLVAPRIDGVDAPGETRLAQEFERPPRRLAGIVRLADQRDRARREQGVVSSAQCPRAAPSAEGRDETFGSPRYSAASACRAR